MQAVEVIHASASTGTVGAFLYSLQSGKLNMRLTPDAEQDIATATKFIVTSKNSPKVLGVLYLPRGCTASSLSPCPIHSPPLQDLALRNSLASTEVSNKSELKIDVSRLFYPLLGFSSIGMGFAAYRLKNAKLFQGFCSVWGFIGWLAIPASIFFLGMLYQRNVEAIGRLIRVDSSPSLFFVVLYPINAVSIVTLMIVSISSLVSFRPLRVAAGTFLVFMVFGP